MTLLAEEIVEEWLNRNGYFTIRGIKLGVHEIDLLALSLRGDKVEARHIEVQASINAVSYLCPVPKSIQKATGRRPASMKHRSAEELTAGVEEWVHKKYKHETKRRLRQALYPGQWKFELVVHETKFPEELDLLKQQGITIFHLDQIVEELSKGNTIIPSSSGADLFDLIMLGRD